MSNIVISHSRRNSVATVAITLPRPAEMRLYPRSVAAHTPAVKPEHAQFIGEIARQLASVCAFLGGFAATFLGILLQSTSTKRHVGWAAGAAAIASVSFMIAVIAGTLVALALHSDAPPDFAAPAFLPWA